jgi:hypothetical protein
MDDLNNLLIQLDIQAHEFQGPQNFHRFPELPIEIREKIWKFSFPDRLFSADKHPDRMA